MASAPSTIWYVYGVAPGGTSSDGMPAGLDDAPVAHERGGDLSALVSRLDAAQYDAARVEAASGDVDWLSPRAMAHDRVLTWASDRGPVVPFPMFSLFTGAAAVRQMLHERGAQLADALARVGGNREYALRVYRVDAELLDAAVSLSPRLRDLAASAAAASPGQRYLLERKLEREKRGETRQITQDVVGEIVAALEPAAAAAARSPIPRIDAEAARGTMVLNAAFLVAPGALERFRHALTSLVERYGASGFRFDFTGPWPAYHFVAEAGRDA